MNPFAVFLVAIIVGTLALILTIVSMGYRSLRLEIKQRTYKYVMAHTDPKCDIASHQFDLIDGMSDFERLSFLEQMAKFEGAKSDKPPKTFNDIPAASANAMVLGVLEERKATA